MQAGEVIKNLRQQQCLTQEQFAKILGVKKSSIQKYESGAVSNLKIQTIRTLCEKFDVSPFVLVFPEKIDDMKIAARFYVGDQSNSRFVDLNDEGMKKIFEYAQDLYDSGKYRRD